MRRILYGLAATALVAALAVVPAVPASAATPVNSFPWLPSAFVAGTTDAPPTLPPGYTDEEYDQWRARDRAYRQTLIDEVKQRSTPATPKTAPQPVGAPKAPTRGPGGSLIGTVLIAPVLIETGLNMIAISSEGHALGLDGSNADQIICNGIGPIEGGSFAALLYGEHDCGIVYADPNAGVQPSWVLSTGSFQVRSGNCSSIPNCGGNPTYWGVSGPSTQLPAGQSYLITYTRANGSTATSVPTWQTVAFEDFPAPGYRGAFNSYATATAWPSGVQFIQRLTGSTVSETVSAPSSADPERQARCTVGWSDGSTSTADGDTYHESESLPLGGLGCEEAYAQRPSPGALPEWVKVESEDDAGAITELADTDIPSEAVQPKPNEGLKLSRIVGTTIRSCMTWEVDCANWWTQSASGTDTSEYLCTFGGATVDLVECGVYRNTFKDPDDVKIMDPAEDHEYSWGTGPDPFTPPGGSTVTGGGACSPNWSWNPVDWVLNPLKCAFIPGSAAIARAQADIDDGIKNSVVGSVGTALASLGTAFDSGVGCGGLPFHLEAFGHTLVDSYLLASCDEPAAGIAATVRTILTFAILGGGVLAFTRYLGSLFGFAAFGKNKSDGGKGPRFD